MRLRKRILNYLDIFSSQMHNKRLFFALLIGLSFIMYFFNSRTPLIADDFLLAFSFDTSERITCVKDIFSSLVSYYNTWGGRVVAHFLSQMFILYDKQLFNFSNTLAFLLLILVVYFFICGRKKEYNILLLLYIIFCLISFCPVFGQCFLWLDGACNYLWCPLLSFAYLLPLRFHLEEKASIISNKLLCIIYGILGIIASWTNEQMSLSMLAIFIFSYILNKRNKRDDLWIICGLIGVLIGGLLLFCSPGNYLRMDSYVGEEFNFHYKLNNFVKIGCSFFDAHYIFLLLCLSGLILVKYYKLLNIRIISLLFVGLFICQFSMVGSPYFPNRAKVFGLLFSIIISGYLFRIFINNSRQQLICVFIVAAFFCSIISQLLIGGAAIIKYHNSVVARITYIENEKALSNYRIELNSISTDSRMCAAFELDDIKADPEYWVNASWRKYYELDTIILVSGK